MRALLALFLLGCAKPEAARQDVVIAPVAEAEAPVAPVLPPATTARIELRVKLSADGKLFAGGQAVANDADLTRITKHALEANPETPVVIDADPQVLYSAVIHVMDVLKSAGATKLSFATPSSSAPLAPPSGAGDPTKLSVVTLRADGSALVDGKPVAGDDAIAANVIPGARVRIDADASSPHGRVIHVLDALKQAGVTKIAFGVRATP